MSKILTSWIETLLKHRTVQVELYGDKVKREVVKGNPQGGILQRWSRGHRARGQGQGHKKNPRPRPRTAFPRTDTLEAKDRNARGQGPRTQAQVLSKKQK